MCRNIVRLREGPTIMEAEAFEAAARQYVRKVSGFQKPSVMNSAAFETAVSEVAAATGRLMTSLVVAGSRG